GEARDPTVSVEEDGRDLDAGEEVGEVGVGPVELLNLAVELGIDGLELLVRLRSGRGRLVGWRSGCSIVAHHGSPGRVQTLLGAPFIVARSGPLPLQGSARPDASLRLTV